MLLAFLFDLNEKRRKGNDKMMKTYEEALQWIHSLLPLGIKPGLKRMEWMLERLEHPERRLKYIHIGGTNGKGSTVSFLRHVLQEEGLNIGTFTSPYIEFFNERIAVNGQPISNEELLVLANQVRPLAEELADTELGSPTEFEIITTIAFLYFAKINIPDIVLLEVGLGGRHDSTNVITPMLSLITNIGHDHMHILGGTKAAIANEKAGIIKPGVPLITTEEEEEILALFEKNASDRRSKIYRFHREFDVQDVQFNDGVSSFHFHCPFGWIANVTLSMSGLHQVKNAALALMALSYLKSYYALPLQEESIRSGMEKTTWIGRFEKLRDKPLVIIDGAHNREGIAALAETIKTNYQTYRIHVLFAATKDKEADFVLEALYPHIEEITFTSFDFFKAANSEVLFKDSSYPHKKEAKDWKGALEEKLAALGEKDLLLITGSLYFIALVREYVTSATDS